VTAFVERITARPLVYDEARGADILASLTKAFDAADELAPAASVLKERPAVRDLLAAALSGAPYLAALALRDPALLADCLLRDPDSHLDEARAELAAASADAANTKAVMTGLRRFKRRSALLVGLADLGGVWSTEETIRRLSDAADASLDQAVKFLFRQAHAAGQIAGPAPKGYFVIAMG
jgi:glutamate-ammonia-ligase adenylyltransferase